MWQQDGLIEVTVLPGSNETPTWHARAVGVYAGRRVVGKGLGGTPETAIYEAFNRYRGALAAIKDELLQAEEIGHV